MERRISSEKIVYKNSNSRGIVGYLDTEHDCDVSERPCIIIPPAFGETKKDNVSLSYYLVSNGFNVIRYDGTFHLGESEGEIIGADLHSMLADLRAAVDWVQLTFDGKCKIGVVASSLAARVALRLAAVDCRIAALVLLVGIVDLRKSIKAIYYKDVIGDYIAGNRAETLNLFGHEVRASFIEGCIKSDLHDFGGTLRDAAKIKVPFTFIAADQDVWVDVNDVHKLSDSLKSGHIKLLIISGALHQLQENPIRAQKVIEQIVGEFSRHFGRVELGDLKRPSIHDIVAQNKIELRILKALSPTTKEGEKLFWSDYLSKFSIIMKSSDYRDLMTTIDQLFGEVRESEVVLDAGCGTGHYGTWLLKRYMERVDHKRDHNSHLTYLGMDLVQHGLRHARNRHREVWQNLFGGERAGINKRVPALGFHYIQGDLDLGIPLPDESVTKACCNLVISYLEEPKQAIRELYRVLMREGTLVLSSLKPFCDLSLVYKKFANMSESEAELDEARSLLNNSGKIRQKEGEGHYHFFSEEDFVVLLTDAGFKGVRTLRSFGNQANVAVARK